MDSDKRAGSAPESEPRVALDHLPLHSTSLLTVLDETGVVEYGSPSIRDIYGFDQDELVGEQVADYFHPDDREDVVSAFRTVVAGDESTVEAIEYRHERADGTYLWVESVASGNPTPNGQYVVNTRDISEQKRRERQLRATNERLNEFASLVSHDLRNPLNVAQGRLDLVAADCDGEGIEVSDGIEVIARAHARMETLIDDLLTLSRVGKQVSETESVALGPLVETCWGTVPTVDATLGCDAERHLLADRSRLRQLLENLFRNSVEHGGEDVTVTVGDLDGGFYVEDDGPGIPEADRDDVFDPGYSTADEGTGFGLSIVKQVTDAHGWEVRVIEATGGGTRFEFTGVPTIDA